MLDPSTGEVIKRRLEHENGEAKMFYATLPNPARVEMEATCDAPWFERVLREHHHELWIGDAAEIRAAMVRKQKTDPRDALHILDLLLTNRFPRIWVPSIDNGVFCKIAQGVEDVSILAPERFSPSRVETQFAIRVDGKRAVAVQLNLRHPQTGALILHLRNWQITALIRTPHS